MFTIHGQEKFETEAREFGVAQTDNDHMEAMFSLHVKKSKFVPIFLFLQMISFQINEKKN